MDVYEPVGFFRIPKSDLERLTREVLNVWPERIDFTDKTFGSRAEYKCGSFTEAYQTAGGKLESADFGQWAELAPIVFHFVASSIKHSSIYLTHIDTAQVDVSPLVTDMAAREDIVIEDANCDLR